MQASIWLNAIFLVAVYHVTNAKPSRSIGLTIPVVHPSTSLPPQTPSKTITTNIKAATATHAIETTESPVPDNSTGLECTCDASKTWLDIMFIVDSTDAMTKNGLGELEDYILTVIYKMNIGQQRGHFSRVGLIVYGSEAKLVYPLTQFNSTDDLYSNWNTPYMGTEGSNLYAAIVLANNHFEEREDDRDNVKQVIVIAASHYEKEQYQDPTTIAEQFRGDGGIIITIEYVQTHGTRVPKLDLLASKNYVLTNSDDDLHADDLHFLFCQANCYCHSNWESYTNSEYETPTAGCYTRVSITSNFQLADRQCYRESATLPVVLDAEKALFISPPENPKEFVWTGLRRVNDELVWSNGKTYTPYKPWAIGEPQKKNGDCVKQNVPSGFNIAWHMADCTDDALYACQRQPCDASNYCS